jgi:hypothetical protein
VSYYRKASCLAYKRYIRHHFVTSLFLADWFSALYTSLVQVFLLRLSNSQDKKTGYCKKIANNFNFFSHGATVRSGPRPPHYRGFTITLRHATLGRTPLDEWSARHRNLYLTRDNTHERQTSMPPSGFEPSIPTSEQPHIQALDRAGTGISEQCLIKKEKLPPYRPGETLRVPELSGSQISNRHMKVVRLSALRTARPYPQQIFMLLIYVGSCVDPRAIVRPEGLCQWKIPVTPLGTETATFLLAAHWLNQLRHRTPRTRLIREANFRITISYLLHIRYSYFLSVLWIV